MSPNALEQKDTTLNWNVIRQKEFYRTEMCSVEGNVWKSEGTLRALEHFEIRIFIGNIKYMCYDSKPTCHK